MLRKQLFKAYSNQNLWNMMEVLHRLLLLMNTYIQQVKFWHVHKERCSFQYFELVLIDCANHYVQICLVFFNRTLRCPWRRINEFIFSSRGGKNHQDSLFNQAKKVITRLRFLNALQAGFWVMKKPFPTWVYVVLIKWTRRLHSKIQNQQKIWTHLVGKKPENPVQTMTSLWSESTQVQS